MRIIGWLVCSKEIRISTGQKNKNKNQVQYSFFRESRKGKVNPRNKDLNTGGKEIMALHAEEFLLDELKFLNDR